eukprot:366546-Chlamydomonas_euryale.AAC.5
MDEYHAALAQLCPGQACAVGPQRCVVDVLACLAMERLSSAAAASELSNLCMAGMHAHGRHSSRASRHGSKGSHCSKWAQSDQWRSPSVLRDNY